MCPGSTRETPALIDQVSLSEVEDTPGLIDDTAWIEVIQRMDSIYADLVCSQVELEEKNAELEDAQRFIQSVNSSISDVLVVCDVDGSIQQVNKALLDFTGKPAKALAGQTLNSLFSEEFAEISAEFFEKIRSESLVDCEISLIDKEGNPSPMAVNCNSRYDHNDVLCGMVLTGRPLGELRRAYQELHKAHEDLKIAQRHLVQSEKMASLGRLVAGVAHELNNPISFVFGNMHALKRYEKRFKEYLKAVHDDVDKAELEDLRKQLKVDRMVEDIGSLIDGSLEGAERVSDIVQNLRRFATPVVQDRKEFDLTHIASSAVQWVLRASRRKPKLNLDAPAKLNIYNVEGLVQQIIINLVQNAVDAMETSKNPELWLSIVANEDTVDVSLRDNGTGIDEKDLVRLFDPFFTTKEVGKGTGLGLYISYNLATEQCNGDLSVENHPEGGAILTLSLPLEIVHV